MNEKVTRMEMYKRVIESISKSAKNEVELDMLKEALFNSASLGYKGERLSFDSTAIGIVLQAMYPAEYADALYELRDKAAGENAKPEDDEF